eukprot:289501-Alexandrium_andersonii.AAC.1
MHCSIIRFRLARVLLLRSLHLLLIERDLSLIGRYRPLQLVDARLSSAEVLLTRLELALADLPPLLLLGGLNGCAI